VWIDIGKIVGASGHRYNRCIIGNTENKEDTVLKKTTPTEISTT
jgi:hypothetical protein